MRPKSAIFYIQDLSAIMEDVIEKIECTKDESNSIDISYIVHEYTLEALAVIFIGTKLGVLQGSTYGLEMISKVKRLFKLFFILFPLPKHIAVMLPIWREFVEISEYLHKISEHHIDKAIEKDKTDGSLNGTVLGKLISRCGASSPVPKVVSVDALSAGLDTTGNSAAFLLYHLATNPGKF